MEIKKILDYQEIDLELRRHESEIEKSDDYRIARQAKHDFETSREAANQCEKKAGEIVNFFSKISNYYEENHKKIDEIESGINGMDGENADLDLLYELGEQLSKLEDMFVKGEKELASMAKKIEDVNKIYKDSMKNAMINKKVFSQSRAKYEEMKNDKTSDMDELKAKLASMEKGIPAVLVDKYKQLRKDKVFPAFVPLEGGKRCGGCRMEQSSGHLSSFSDGMAECESCRRIIYKQ